MEVEIGDEKYHTSVTRSKPKEFPTPSVVYFVSFVDFDRLVMWYCGFTWLAPRWIHHTYIATRTRATLFSKGK